MNDDVKTKWVTALRSGKYQQTQGRLRAGDGQSFCCLGVLCDLYVKATPGVLWDGYYSGGKLLGESNYLPKEVIEWAGLPIRGTHEDKECLIPNPVVNPNPFNPKAIKSLAIANDHGMTFPEIAAIIREQF